MRNENTVSFRSGRNAAEQRMQDNAVYGRNDQSPLKTGSCFLLPRQGRAAQL